MIFPILLTLAFCAPIAEFGVFKPDLKAEDCAIVRDDPEQGYQKLQEQFSIMITRETDACEFPSEFDPWNPSKVSIENEPWFKTLKDGLKTKSMNQILTEKGEEFRAPFMEFVQKIVGDSYIVHESETLPQYRSSADGIPKLLFDDKAENTATPATFAHYDGKDPPADKTAFPEDKNTWDDATKSRYNKLMQFNLWFPLNDEPIKDYFFGFICTSNVFDPAGGPVIREKDLASKLFYDENMVGNAYIFRSDSPSLVHTAFRLVDREENGYVRESVEIRFLLEEKSELKRKNEMDGAEMKRRKKE